MKKLMILAAGMMLAVSANAASVGWSAAGMNSYAGDAYQFFVIGQKGADTIKTITDLLDVGSSAASYEIGSGTINSSGMAYVAASNSGKSIDGTGEFTGFFVIFDSATPVAGTTKYAVISGQPNMTKTIGQSTASVLFAAGSVADYVGDASNWQIYGEPEPTSALMMLFGLAGLALRRKRA